MDRRQATTAETRARILTAARELLMASGVAGFSVEAVAQKADVARMTVYYQFGSKLGLLEALFDELASQGGMEQLAGAFQRPDPLEALSAFIATFARFWASDRLVMRRLRGLASVDPDLEQGVRARDERRRQGARIILRRLAQEHGKPAPRSLDEMVDVLFTLTSFETFDTLAGPDRSPVDVAPLVDRLARAALSLDQA